MSTFCRHDWECDPQGHADGYAVSQACKLCTAQVRAAEGTCVCGSPIVTVARKGNAKLQYHDWTVGDTKGRQWGICVPEGESFPNMGFDPRLCPHPSGFWGHYFSDGSLGHGYFCTLCGEFLQAG